MSYSYYNEIVWMGTPEVSQAESKESSSLSYSRYSSTYERERLENQNSVTAMMSSLFFTVLCCCQCLFFYSICRYIRRRLLMRRHVRNDRDFRIQLERL